MSKHKHGEKKVGSVFGYYKYLKKLMMGETEEYINGKVYYRSGMEWEKYLLREGITQNA